MKTTTGFKRGFGSPNYNPAKAREVRSAGQRALVASGKVHRFASFEEASAAGQKGGAKTAALYRARKEQRGQEAA